MTEHRTIIKQRFPQELEPSVVEHASVEAMFRWWATWGGIPLTYGDPVVKSLSQFSDLEAKRSAYLNG